MNSWKIDIYEQIKERLIQLSWLQDFRLENNQFENSGEDNAEAILFPAITLTFDEIVYHDTADDNQHVDCQLVLRVGMVSEDVDDLEILSRVDQVSAKMSEGFEFGTPTRNLETQDTDHDNLHVWEIGFLFVGIDCYVPEPGREAVLTTTAFQLTYDIDNYDIRTGDGIE